MRKNKLFIFMLAFILSISCLSTIAFSHSNTQSSDDTELNWYFVNRGKDTLPECPKEATGLLSKYDAYYLGDTNEKVIYLTFDEGYENGYTPKILDVLKEENIRENECFTNVIGGFKDGYYHGEMYLMTTDEHGKINEWSATCENGVWVPFIKGNTTDAIFESYEKDENGESKYHYIYPEDNKNYGIIGLKK